MSKLKGMMSSNSNEWETPQDLFDGLNTEFHFTLDPCATEENAKCKKFYTKKDDGLFKSWRGESVFMNPPYGREIDKWVKKACAESGGANIIVALIPARTDTRYWHDYIFGSDVEIRFIKGRLKFINRTFPSCLKDNSFKISSAPFPSAIVIWK